VTDAVLASAMAGDPLVAGVAVVPWAEASVEAEEPRRARLCRGRALTLWGGGIVAPAVVGALVVVAPAVVVAAAVVVVEAVVVVAAVVVVEAAAVVAAVVVVEAVVSPVVVAPAGAVLDDCALRAAVLPAIQPLTALAIASVLATSDSRERQPARVLWLRSPRSISETFGQAPERSP
jgi:hypothetical protein